MPVSVIVPTVRPEHLNDTLAAICRQTYTDWELIVVAQGNHPELRAIVEKGHSDSRVRFLHLQESGLSLARNAGIAAAQNPTILFTDDDCEPQQDWIRVVVECFRDHPDVQMVSGSLIAPARPFWQIASCPHVLPAEVIYDPAVSFGKPPAKWKWAGGNFAIRREAYDKVGPFDKYLGPGARFPVADDTDFGFRMENARLQMMCTNRSVVNHTYGTRVGLQNMLKNSRNYARGNGAMAAKLTLMGDPRGEDWLRITQGQAMIYKNLYRLHRYPVAVRRVHAFEEAYHECIRDFCVNEKGLLQLRNVLTASNEHALQHQLQTMV